MGKNGWAERQKKTQFSDSVNMKMSFLLNILSGQINVFFVQFCRQHKSNDLASAITVIGIKDKAWEREFFFPV